MEEVYCRGDMGGNFQGYFEKLMYFKLIPLLMLDNLGKECISWAGILCLIDPYLSNESAGKLYFAQKILINVKMMFFNGLKN